MIVFIKYGYHIGDGAIVIMTEIVTGDDKTLNSVTYSVKIMMQQL
jgi:hypothetical protein